MKKLNRNYLSFYEWLGPLFGLVHLPKQPKNYSYHGFRYHDGSYTPSSFSEAKKEILIGPTYMGYQLLGAFQPFAAMAKDFVDTFRPYAAPSKFDKDASQPLRGVVNLVKGVGSFLGGAVLTIGWIPIALFMLAACKVPLFGDLIAKPFLKKIAYPVSWMLEGTGNIIQGAAQIVTWPLTALFKIPLRGLLTGIANWKNKKFFAEDKPQIQRLVAKANNKITKIVKLSEDIENEKKKGIKKKDLIILEKDRLKKKAQESTATLLFAIQRNYVKSVKKGWEPKLGPHAVTGRYGFVFNDAMELDTKEADRYLKLFTSPPPIKIDLPNQQKPDKSKKYN